MISVAEYQKRIGSPKLLDHPDPDDEDAMARWVLGMEGAWDDYDDEGEYEEVEVRDDVSEDADEEDTFVSPGYAMFYELDHAPSSIIIESY